MKIRVIKRVPGQRWTPGNEPTVNNALGKILIAKGFAEPLEVAPKVSRKTDPDAKPTDKDTAKAKRVVKKKTDDKPSDDK